MSEYKLNVDFRFQQWNELVSEQIFYLELETWAKYKVSSVRRHGKATQVARFVEVKILERRET